jgi:phosphatidylinositol alpha-1,6-mannosyltransferase
LRLAVVTNDYPPQPGGIQQYLANLVAAWPHPVRVLAPRAVAPTDGEHIVRGPRRFMWPTPQVRRWVERELAEFAAEVVLFGAPHPLSALGPGLRRRLGLPFGVLAHGAEVAVPAAVPGLRQLLASTLRAADARFAVSRHTQGRVERLTGRPVTYLGAGVDIDAFRPTRRPERRVPVLGCVSRFVPRKGQHRLIEAAARLGAAGHRVEVLLVGRGRTEASLRRLAARRAVAARFAVDVPWDDLPAWYGSMDVFCMPCRSRWGGLEVEGLGLVFLEAAACGLPVLAGDSGGAPETVEPGRSGFVVRTVADIVEGVQYLLEDPARAGSMGAAGRARVEAEFTWPAVAARLQTALHEVTGG